MPAQMTSETAEDLLRGYIESEGVESTARYVRAGRAHKDLPDKALQAAWVAAFKAWSPDDDETGLLEDLASELSLRGLSVGHGLTAQDLQEMAAKVASMGPFSAEADERLAEDVEAYNQARTSKSN